MPRMGGGRSRSRSSGSGFGGSQRSYASQPPPRAPAPQHPSMFRQMAATAGGVVAGGMILGALSGGGRREGESDYGTQEQVQDNDPCAKELRNLILCIEMAQETGSDLKICTDIEKKLIECRQKYGMPPRRN